jgi:hypothetical protein
MDQNTAIEHMQLRLAAAAAKPTLAQLREERERLVLRQRDVEQSIQLLEGVIDAWERIDRRNDPLLAQLQRIDKELRAAENPRAAARRQAYNGQERRLSPRPPPVAVPLVALAAGEAEGRIRGAVLERARRLLQAGKGRTEKAVEG